MEGLFISPNEYGNYKFSSILKQSKDILISVGTFRTLFNTVMGHFSYVIMFDHDQKVTDFNQANLDLIEGLGNIDQSVEIQRLLYLSIICRKPIEVEQIALFITTFQNSKLSTNQRLILFLHFLQKEKEKEKLTDKITILSNLVVPYYKMILTSSYDPTLFTRLFRLSYLDEHNESSLKKINMNYWCSDNNWLKIQTMVKMNKIVAITGSLTGSHILVSIGHLIKKENCCISTIDLSNAIGYIFKDKKAMQLWNNLKNLPVSKCCKILYTTMQDEQSISSDDNWTYCSLSFNLFEKFIKTKC